MSLLLDEFVFPVAVAQAHAVGLLLAGKVISTSVPAFGVNDAGMKPPLCLIIRAHLHYSAFQNVGNWL
jgi:hypothetical protein